jgi:hypothetical protein
LAYDALAQSSTDAIDDSAKCKVIVNQTIPAEGDLTKANDEKKLFINIRNIELSVCYVAPAGKSYIPRSVALKFSPMSVSTLAVRNKSINMTTVVPPATRLVYLMLKQTGIRGPQLAPTVTKRIEPCHWE